MTGPPAEFADLEKPREMLVDLYFGKRPIGEAWIVASPGKVRFRDPSSVLKLIPNLKPAPELAERLAGELEDNAGRSCTPGGGQQCGTLEPASIGAIFSEDLFRLDLFVNPAFLDLADREGTYLPTPAAPFSLTSAI